MDKGEDDIDRVAENKVRGNRKIIQRGIRRKGCSTEAKQTCEF
jgi:hypothetical protein